MATGVSAASSPLPVTAPTKTVKSLGVSPPLLAVTEPGEPGSSASSSTCVRRHSLLPEAASPAERKRPP